jgi:hypothetical protein
MEVLWLGFQRFIKKARQRKRTCCWFLRFGERILASLSSRDMVADVLLDVEGDPTRENRESKQLFGGVGAGGGDKLFAGMRRFF